ncbi:MAG: 16S rRNA (uracil(1498)-N(3))-methyltransferase [Cyclobacteriaceae bacterium]
MQNLFYQPDILFGITYLNPEESHHCINVMRKKNGDTIFITNGQGGIFEAVITRPDSSQCSFRIIRTVATTPRQYSFRLAIAPTKNSDRMEWMVEKCIEIGIDRISFIQTIHSERTLLKTSRLEKIVTSAMKQALQPYRPVIDPISPFSDFLKSATGGERFIAHAGNTNTPHLMDLATAGCEYTVLIGPEGDFASNELALAKASGFKEVTLGTSRLRTETAGLVACNIINLVNRNLQ